MSFIFSQAPAEASSLENCSGIDASAQSKSIRTRKESCSPGKKTARSRGSRSSATFAHLMLNPSEDVLTSFLAGFPVRTSAAPAIEQASRAPDPDSGKSSYGWFARLSPTKSEWKTPQISLLGDSESFSETWPRWGSMRDGVCYLLPTLAPTISVNASGSLLPTLTVNGNNNRPYPGKKSGYGLATAIALLPTLTTIGLNGGSNSRRATAKRGEPPTHLGPLNPDWCEWFMGFPIGWTVSTALEMLKFHEWQQQHSIYSADKE
jgi:hypothetical protein